MEFLFADMDGAEDGLLCLLDNLACSVGVFVVKDGIVHLRYLNDEYYAMLGTKRSERLQRFTECPLDAVHPDDLPGLMRELSACLKEERELNYSMRLKNGQDRYTWVNVRANRMGCKENSTLLYAVYSDLTKEKTILNQLEETTASLHAAVSCSSLHSWMYFPKERRMVFTGGEHSGLPNVIELNNFPDAWVEMGMVHPDDVAAYLAEYKKIDDGAKNASCDVRIKNVDGWHWERINLVSLYDANGERTKVIGIADLLDDYKELEMRFSIAAAQSGLTTWVYDIAEKKMIIDSSSSNITNCPSIVENVPESLFEMNAVHPDDAESVRETFQAIGQGIKKFAVCDARWREDGKNWCWRRVFYTVIFDKNDRPIKAIGSSIDISEQKEAEEKYRKYRENVAAVTPNALGSFHLNITKNLCFDGTSRYAVVRALDKDGTADSFLDTLKTMIPDRAERETFSSIFERDSLLTAFEQGRSFLSLDYKASIGKEAPAWVSTCISMVKNPASGDVEGIIYAIDINEKKLAEQKTNRELEAALKKAECAIASKGEFLSRMSHDMRTPLNAIIGLSELAIENKTDAAETISYMEKIHASGQYLLGLINDILNMSKIESKKMKLNLEYTEASNLFKRIRQIINPIMKEKNINFFFDTDDFGKKYILTD
ncbi:MAG: PAS domain-containing sensor histidine kinase, partial [Synergistaceae bacterium]